MTELLENIARATGTDRPFRKPSGFSEELSDRKASAPSPLLQADPIALRELWSKCPGQLVWVRTGDASGIDVVDFDFKHRRAKDSLPETGVERRPGRGAERDCSWRWKREGRRVRIARPPKGMEVNDLLVGGAPSPMRGAR